VLICKPPTEKASWAFLDFLRSTGTRTKSSARVLDLIRTLANGTKNKDKPAASGDIRAGIGFRRDYCGCITESRGPLLLANGEPMNLARRFLRPESFLRIQSLDGHGDF